ncbi:MAG: sigma-70 family RNA polymerase sigma factor [Candidatus Hydrogenedentes bacterium]|nr:sigma-70 family RNA polymerase sigma factor [Candidatus Hydrogenedentota bacterium]
MRGKTIDIVRLFYELNRQELFTYALALTRSREAAEDVVQNVFRNVLNRPRLPGDLRPYVFRAIRNAAVDEHRAQARIAALESIFDLPGHRNNGHDPAVAQELDALLQQLNEQERECIVLKTYNGLTFAEIGDVCGVSMNTAASWYRRGIEKLRALMKEDV